MEIDAFAARDHETRNERPQADDEQVTALHHLRKCCRTGARRARRTNPERGRERWRRTNGNFGVAVDDKLKQAFGMDRQGRFLHGPSG